MKTIRLLALLTLVLPILAGPLHAGDAGLLIRFGLNDGELTDWSGDISVSPGRVALLSGWRFEKSDDVTGVTGWSASTRPVQQRNTRSNNPDRKKNTKVKVNMMDNGVLVTLAGTTPASMVSVKTKQGEFSFKLDDVPVLGSLEKLDGGVAIERTAATWPLTEANTDDDFPAIAKGADGSIYVAYVSFTPGLDRDTRSRSFEKAPEDLSYLTKPTGGDKIWMRVHKAGAWGQPVAVTAGDGDIYKCAVAVDGTGSAWVFWSERKDDNFDIWGRAMKDGAHGEPVRISDNPGNDVSPVAAADSKGRVCVAWQGAQDGVFKIVGTSQEIPGGAFGAPQVISTGDGNCWTPAIAAAEGAEKVAVAWDTYQKGDYDVWVREMSAREWDDSLQVAGTPDYEARPSLTYDASGNLWVAWEESGPSWGKDWGAYEKEAGIPLYSDRTIGVRVLADGVLKDPAAPIAQALPGKQTWDSRVPEAAKPEGTTTRAPGSHAVITGAVTMNNLARLATDGSGRIWLIARSKMGNFRSAIGSVWMNYASYLDGDRWVGPVLLPHSDNLLYNQPAAIGAPEGGLLVAHSSDHRQTMLTVWEASKTGENQLAQSLLEATKDPFINNLYVSRLNASGSPAKSALKDSPADVSTVLAPSPETEKERGDVKRIRDYRATVNGAELRILRGEFHRHTEISGDGGNDGPLEDMWRYAVDVALFDWIGNGDHDNGGHREYPWWMTQKTTDAFHLPGRFDPLFTYERSVKYPEGHRNVVFVQRGVRTLPRLPISSELRVAPAPDTQLLYKYLHQFGGICAVHTSATDMGTDWRDNDPVVEPFVEIYQGARQNYERPGAPRSPTADDAIGGWRPKGFINLALKQGYRLAFQSSSDHRSTHISYCNVYAESPSRQGIFDGMKTRHVYGATDNIIADYRCRTNGREYMMGDEFTTTGPPQLDIVLIGTAPFEKVVIVKDDVEVHTATPNEAEVRFSWTDPQPETGGTSYYYVRGEQADTELVWVSPMWIKYQP